MKKKTIFTLVTAVVAVLVLSVIGAVLWLARQGQGDNSATAPHTTTISPEGKEITELSVDWMDGAVFVCAGESDFISITEQGESGALKESEQMSVSCYDGVLAVEWGEKKLFHLSFFDSHRKSVTITLPPALLQELTRVTCETMSGPITLKDCTAETMEVRSVSGDILLQHAGGETLSISTVSGSQWLEACSFTVQTEAKTTSGAVQLEQLETDTLSLTTTSGKVSGSGAVQSIIGSTVSAGVTLALQTSPNRIELESVSGDLQLCLPENDGFYLDYETVSGSVVSDFTLSGGLAKSGKALYKSGVASYRMRTTSGDMIFTRGGKEK